MIEQGFIQENKTTQQQVVSQQTITLMRLVEIPYASLEQEITKEVYENPALETYRDNEVTQTDVNEDNASTEYDDEGDPKPLTSERSDEEVFSSPFSDSEGFDDAEFEGGNYCPTGRNDASDDGDRRMSMGVYCESQYEQWRRQLEESSMSDRERFIAEYLLGCLEDSGYLTLDLQLLVNDLIINSSFTTSVEEVERVLKHFIQELDPAGTGARNLQECLLIQLNRNQQPSAMVDMAKRILTDCYEAFTRKHYDKIQRSLSITSEQLREAIEVIQTLDPRPAGSLSPIQALGNQVIPDFIVTLRNNKLSLTLNNSFLPKLRIDASFNNLYQQTLNSKNVQRKEVQDQLNYMKENLDKAEKFIGTLSLRELIMYNTMSEIMRIQEQYFRTGEESCLKPMILKDVADRVKVDISTVSRFSNSKYVQTDFGVIAVKQLFSEAVNDDDTSSREIKSVLMDIINNENKSKPLSDEKLCAKLREKGYDIARRTVAKYRDQMNIPVASMRKEV